MQWFIASVNGIGDCVFKADPDKMEEPFFEVQKLACVVSHPQRGLGLSKWVGHFAKLAGPVGKLRSSAIGLCYPIQDNEFIKKAEELGSKDRAEGSRLVIPDGPGGFRSLS